MGIIQTVSELFHCAGRGADRPHHRGRRRQGRCRRIDRRAQSRLGHRAQARRRQPSSSISTSPSERPASTSTRIRRRVSPRRCSPPDRLDGNLVDRLLSRCGDNLSLLAASAMLDRTVDLTETALDQLLDILRASTPTVVLDLPHTWTGWTRRTLISADDVVVVAAPELASLRNAKNLIDVLRAGTAERPASRRSLLNLTGMPKRPEIAAAEFAKALEIELSAVVPFDAQLFGTAANNGQMIAEIKPGGKVNECSSTSPPRSPGGRSRARSGPSLLKPIISKFTRRRHPEVERGTSGMFGKRSGICGGGGRSSPHAPVRPRRLRRASNIAARQAIARARACPSRHRRPRRRKSDEYYQTKRIDLRRADRGDRSGAAFASRIRTRRARRSATSSARSSPSRTW